MCSFMFLPEKIVRATYIAMRSGGVATEAKQDEQDYKGAGQATLDPTSTTFPESGDRKECTWSVLYVNM